MALYAIGDIQGCYQELIDLLDKIDFEPGRDRLWLTGDLVNRGPRSLETLRFVKSLGEHAVTVLGNHDLHLLAVAYGVTRARKKDTLEPILLARDRLDLIDWLRHRPLFHRGDSFCLLHAGLPPQWDSARAQLCAAEAEAVLRGEDCRKLLGAMYGNFPDVWSESLSGFDRLRFILNCFTRLRYCDIEGRIALDAKGPPGSQGKHLYPWFEAPNRKSVGTEIVFGHWSTLGFYAGNGCFGIDTGCLWGGALTALRLDGEMYHTRIACPGYREPGKNEFY